MLTLVRIERDFTRGELCQFQTAFPLEIDGRIEPRRFQKTIDDINELLEKAHHPKYNILDNFFACLTIYTSTFCIKSNYDKRIDEILKYLHDENVTLYNLKGLNFKNPIKTSFLFLELEIYKL